MVDQWIAILPAILVGAALLIVPGAVLGYAIGLRGFAPIGVAAPISTGIIASAGVVLKWLGLPFVPENILLYAVVGVLVLAAPFAIGRATRLIRPRRDPALDWRSLGTGLVALVVGAAVGVRLTLLLVGGPEEISQLWDNVYHLNEIWHIVNTHNGSIYWANEILVGIGSPAYYPNAWHAVAATTVMLTGVDVPAAANIMVLLQNALVTVSGTVFLAQTLGSRGWVRQTAAGLMASAFSAFPLIPLTQGTLYPYGYGLSLLPAAMAILVHLVGMATRPRQRRVAAAVATCVVILGVGMSHPSAILSLWGISVVLSAAWLLHWLLGPSSGWRKLLGAAAIAGVALVNAHFFVWGWLTLRPGIVAGPGRCLFDTCIGATQAIKQWLVQDQFTRWPLFLLGALILVGAWAALSRRQYWAIAIWLVSGAMWVIGADSQEAPLRELLNGVYFTDTFRIAALAAVCAIPLAVMGVDELVGLAQRPINALDRLVKRRHRDVLRITDPRDSERPSGLLATALSAGLVALILIATQSALAPHIAKRSENYRYSADSQLLTTDERDLLLRLDRYVPPDAKIFVAPETGAALAYAFANRQVVPYYMFSVRTPAIEEVRKYFQNPAHHDAVCAAIAEMGVSYILDFGTHVVNDRKWTWNGIENLAAPFVEVVATRGEARLLKITLCG